LIFGWNGQYAGKTKEERQKLGQFFTPPQLTIQMIEKFENLEGNILDPTVGCGRVISSMYNSRS
jgi:type I restriction-modification system DNA methylase subunit